MPVLSIFVEGMACRPFGDKLSFDPVLKLYARYISECTGLAPEIMITPTSHGCYAVTSHRPIGCLFKDLIWLTPKTPSKPCITGRFVGIWIHPWPVDSPHQGPVIQTAFPRHDAIRKNASQQDAHYFLFCFVYISKLDWGFVWFTNVYLSITCMVVSRHTQCNWSNLDGYG